MASKRQFTATNEEGHPSKRRLQFTNDLDSDAVGETSAGDADQSGGHDLSDGNVSMAGFVDDMAVMADPLEPGSSHQHDAMIREQDRFLPIANVSRIMKRVLPESGKVAKEAKECIQECVSEFISFITSEASERCMHEKRKTINGEDILWAMQTLGFDAYVEPLKMYLSKYRMAAKGDKNGNSATGAVYTQGLIVVGGKQDGRAVGKDDAGGQLYLAQDDVLLRTSGDQRQVHLTTGADGQLAIFEMGDADGQTDTADVSATAISLPVLTGATAGDNGTQQYILTALDQNSISGAGIQQFALPAGAQLAFIPSSGASASATATTSQGIPVVFLDSAASSHQQSPQYITIPASGASGGAGLQLVHVAPSSMVGTGAGGEDAGRNGAPRSARLAVSEGQ